MLHFYYTDSGRIRHQIKFEANEYNSLMELIWDKGYEDWGDCKGRAWCATCHIQINNKINTNAVDQEESSRINLLSNRTDYSRLSCQLLLTLDLDGAEVEYRGGD